MRKITINNLWLVSNISKVQIERFALCRWHYFSFTTYQDRRKIHLERGHNIDKEGSANLYDLEAMDIRVVRI